MSGLFRKEAMDNRKESLYGNILLLPSISHSVITVCIVLWAIFILVWLCTGKYSRKVSVLGWIESPQGLVNIYSSAQGVIEKVFVTEGEYVSQNQPLLILRDDRILASGDNLDSSIIAEYEAQSVIIEGQISGIENSYIARAQNIEDRIKVARYDLQLIEDQLLILKKRYTLISSKVKRYRSLKSKGHISLAELDDVVSDQLAIKSAKNELLRESAAQENIINSLLTDRELLPHDKATDLANLHSNLSEIHQKTNQIRGQQSYIIRATAPGIVNNLQVNFGQKISTNNRVPFLTIHPIDPKIEAYLFIPVRSIGFVEEGQKISIRYDAFPYQKFGIYSGSITNVSKSLLLPGEILGSPINIQEAVYRVRVTLADPNVHAYGKSFTLKAGMTLSADVILEERSLIQWMLEPLYSLRGRI